MPQFIRLTLLKPDDASVLGAPLYVDLNRIVSYSQMADPRKLTFIISTNAQYAVAESVSAVKGLIEEAIKSGCCHVRSDGPPA